jgi:hypothetical protein
MNNNILWLDLIKSYTSLWVILKNASNTYFHVDSLNLVYLFVLLLLTKMYYNNEFDVLNNVYIIYFYCFNTIW